MAFTPPNTDEIVNPAKAKYSWQPPEDDKILGAAKEQAPELSTEGIADPTPEDLAAVREQSNPLAPLAFGTRLLSKPFEEAGARLFNDPTLRMETALLDRKAPMTVARPEEPMIKTPKFSEAEKFVLPNWAKPFASIYNAITQDLEGFTTPGSALILPLAGEEKGVQALFLTQAASQLPEQWQRVKDAKTKDEKIEAYTHLVDAAGMAGLLAKGMASEAPVPKPNYFDAANEAALKSTLPTPNGERITEEFRAGEKRNVPLPARVRPANPPVPVEPGPLGVIPYMGTTPTRSRLIPMPKPRIRIDLAQPSTTEVSDATQEGSQPENSVGKYPGVPQGGNIPENEAQVREANRGPAGGGGSDVDRTPQQAQEPPEVLKDPAQIKSELITQRISAGISPDNLRVTIAKDPAVQGFGFAQVDEVYPERGREGNVFSSNPEEMRSLGFSAMPPTSELMKLPAGRYTLSEAKQKLQELTSAPVVEKLPSAAPEPITGRDEQKGSAIPAEAGVSPALGAAAPENVQRRRTTRAEKDRPWDIIDQIQGEFGSIDPALIRQSNPDWKPIGAARKLFKTGGYRADNAATALSRSGHFTGDPNQVDQLGNVINEAAAARKGWRKNYSKEESQADIFAAKDDAFKRDINRRTKDTRTLVPDDLNQGDIFTLNGAKMRVTELSFDEDGNVESITLDDGNRYGTQTVRGDTMLRMDKDSLIKSESAKREAEFLPATTDKTSGELFAAKDIPFNLETETARGAAPKAEPTPQPELLNTKPVDVESEPVKPKVDQRPLTKSEQKEFSELTLKDRAAREQGGPRLNTEETKRYEYLTALAGQEELPMEGKLTEAQKSTISAVQKYRIGKSPQTYSLIEKLPASKVEIENGEQPVRVKNDMTGDEQTLLEQDLTPVRERTAAEREASKGATRSELDDALRKAGVDPKDFPGMKAKREAVKRFRAKAEDVASKLEGLKSKGKGNVYSSIFPGMEPESFRAMWNTAIDVAQQVIRAGGTIADAIESAVAFIRRNAVGSWEEARVRSEMTNALQPTPAEEPVSEAASEPVRARHQVAGVRDLGSEYEPERIAEMQGRLRGAYFDGTQPTEEIRTQDAWTIASRMTNPETRGSFAEEIRNNTGGEMAPGLLVKELWDYSIKLAAQRDTALLRFIIGRYADFETMAGGGSFSKAGATLRAARELAGNPLWKALVRISKDEAKAAGRSLGIGETLADELLSRIADINLTDAELDRVVREGQDSSGRTIDQIVEQASPETMEAQRILDQYEKSQTEWLKPGKQLSAIRQIIRESIAGGPAAKFREQNEFVSFVSQRFQDATVPKEIADRLAFEVWKDKQARESAATAKAVRAGETREQRNAEALLDQWSKEQTEWVKPEVKNLTKQTVNEWLKRTVSEKDRDSFISSLSERLQRDGVPERIANELSYQTWNKKTALDASRVQRELDRESKKLAEQAEKTAQGIVNRMESSQTEWLKPNSPKSEVLKIIKDALDPKTPLPAEEPTQFLLPLRDRLIAAGVKDATAFRLAREIYNKRITDWVNARSRAMSRAAESKSVRSLIEAIQSTPYRAQQDPVWRMKTAVDWFLSNGLDRPRAEAAAKAFSDQYENALKVAAEREARQILKGRDARTIEDVVRAIRSGLTDPSRSWSEDIAKRSKWVPLTPDQHAKLATLEQKYSDPSLSPHEKVDLHEQINAILRHVGNHDGAFWRFLGESQAASLLSGTRTTTLHIFQPLLTSVKDMVVATITQPKDVGTFVRALWEAGKNWLPEAKYAWERDAYSFDAHQIGLFHNELKRQFELGTEELKSKDPKKMSTGALRLTYAWQQYVIRSLKTANQAGMAVVREWKMALYGARAMRDVGLSTKQIGELVDVAIAAKEAAYLDGLDMGLSDNAARVRADDVVAEQLQNFFSNKVGDTEAAKISKAAENDTYSAVGRRAPGIGEMDEGFLSRPLNFLMSKASEARREGGGPSILTVSMIGFVNIPFRMIRYLMNFSGYGLFRYGIDRYRTSRGLETYWKQSFANDLQARARLQDAAIGTAVTLAFVGWQKSHHTSDDNAKNKPFAVYATGSGPKNKVLRDAWIKAGFKPFSLNFVVDGHIVAVPITRVGDVLAPPLGLAAALDDVAWRNKEDAAAGKGKKEGVTREVAQMVATYYEIIGAQGIFQSFSHISQLGQGEGNMAKTIASALSGVASPLVLPGRQLLSMASDMFAGPIDRSSIESAIAANFPVVGAPWQHKAINRFGDALYDQSFYGKVQRTGIPVAFKISDTPENRQIYQRLLDKGAAPPELRRYLIEEKYGPLTDDQWSKYAKLSGDILKQAVIGNAANIDSMAPEDVKKFLAKNATDANNQAAAALGLEAQEKPGRSSRAASAAPAGENIPSGPSGRAALPAASRSGGKTGGVRASKASVSRSRRISGAGPRISVSRLRSGLRKSSRSRIGRSIRAAGGKTRTARQRRISLV